VDAPRDFAMATRLVERGAQVGREVLGDTSMELRELNRAARERALIAE
jgi:chlorobenzene dioxygenase NADH-ferredoxin reductase/biphenyl 2,3-dioxygenase ferredoxin reductase subunit/benzene/toluene dioxygenase ferredoxin reductase subunit